MKTKLIVAVTSIVLALAVTEVALRLLEPPEHPDAETTGHFIRGSAALGWDGKPGATGHFANGHCYGTVTLDERGIRRNAAGGTYVDGYRNILFIGDSNTAALEVDDEQTAPARLEQGLRSQGLEVNVLNLGVRGYGTDQSVRRALALADDLHPEQIVYLYSDNDVFDNNVLREVGRRFGKGVYWRPGVEFEALNYPVPGYRDTYFGVVILDPDGKPLVYEGQMDPSVRTRRHGWPDRTWRLYRMLADLRGGRVDRRARVLETARADPFELDEAPGADPVDVLLALFYGLVDGGRLRHDHGGYYDAQLEFLMRQLWRIPTLRKVHIVEFPNLPTLGLLAAGEQSDNLRLFDDLVDAGVAQEVVSLSAALRAQGIEYRTLTCRGGDHFSNVGQEWVGEVLLASLDIGDGEPAGAAAPR